MDRSILLIGAGKIGSAIAKLLTSCEDYNVVVADSDQGALDRLRSRYRSFTNIGFTKLSVTDRVGMEQAMRGKQAVVSACSFYANTSIAEAALENGLSYFDLTEDVATTKAITRFAKSSRAGQIFMPQCGLAPGFICIVANDLAKRLDSVEDLAMRVGALPMYPSNALRYNLTWSTDGLINEYCNMCEAIHNGKFVELMPLEGLEGFSIDGVDYEAFNTSGGLGTLAESLQGRVKSLNYKTIRYPGHRDLMAFLVNELKMSSKRDKLKEMLESAIPVTMQDVVLVFCVAKGQKNGRFEQVSDVRKIYHGTVDGEEWSAIQKTTAAGICAAIDLHFAGLLPNTGFVRQEDVTLEHFLANRFGKVYA